MHIQIVGFSHTNAVRAALKAEPGLLPCAAQILHILLEVPERKFLVHEDGVQQLDPRLRTKILAHPDDDKLVFSQVGGNVHSFLGLFRHPEPFDFILPGQPRLVLDDGAALLTYGYVAAAMRRMLALDFAILAALARTTTVLICHLESPPPIADSAYCQANLPPSFQPPPFQGMAVAAPSLRYKVWRLHSTLVAAECRRLGINFLPCPTESMDEDGFLLPQYYADPLHGNVEYGKLLLRQMAAFLTPAGHREPAHG